MEHLDIVRQIPAQKLRELGFFPVLIPSLPQLKYELQQSPTVLYSQSKTYLAGDT
ncbi:MULTISPECIES: hypothetical protein [Fischerella]|uniref:hypothetical protein n=1 Tax=Fischerella TaxID=1190 RepID=UPI0002E9D330|nr:MULTISPECIES: hypothetical protein [Fischerella]MBD2434685.1 hypothetical protein [Fischerella sp. FACHB-380]